MAKHRHLHNRRRFLATSQAVNVIGNTFLNVLDDGSGNHTDMIQWYGGSNPRALPPVECAVLQGKRGSDDRERTG